MGFFNRSTLFYQRLRPSSWKPTSSKGSIQHHPIPLPITDDCHICIFSYGAPFVFDPEILDITDADLLDKLQTGVRNAAMSLAMNYPNVASVPHSIVNGMKNLLAIAAATEITFKEAETVKAFLADPSAFAAVAAPAAAAAAAPAAKEESEEEDDDMGFGLFD